MDNGNSTRRIYEPKVRAFPILRYFEYQHLSIQQQRIYIPFKDVAWNMVDIFYSRTVTYQEVTVGLRHLLQSLDCMVRAEVSRAPEFIETRPYLGTIPPINEDRNE